MMLLNFLYSQNTKYIEILTKMLKTFATSFSFSAQQIFGIIDADVNQSFEI